MTKPKNKPKIGDVVGWAVVDRDFDVVYAVESRSEARRGIARDNAHPHTICKPFRIAKIVLAK